jgi:signal transduction histidine kinase
MQQDEKTSPLFEVMKQETVQTVVHDLRTPITVVKGYLDLLMSGAMGAMPKEQMQVLERSVGPLQELMLLTENLLQATSLDQHEVTLIPSPTDLDRLLAETIEFYQLPFAQRRMQIFRKGNTLGMTLRVDGFWVRRVLHNLIWNAFKFTPDGGKVMLHVRHTPNDGLQIVVQDTGRGIPADKVDAIFDKFEQAAQVKDRRLGTGLGLWICKRVMELHGGTIHAESHPGQGSRFVIEFPSSAVLPYAVPLRKPA